LHTYDILKKKKLKSKKMLRNPHPVSFLPLAMWAFIFGTLAVYGLVQSRAARGLDCGIPSLRRWHNLGVSIPLQVAVSSIAVVAFSCVFIGRSTPFSRTVQNAGIVLGIAITVCFSIQVIVFVVWGNWLLFFSQSAETHAYKWPALQKVPLIARNCADFVGSLKATLIGFDLVFAYVTFLLMCVCGFAVRTRFARRSVETSSTFDEIGGGGRRRGRRDDERAREIEHLLGPDPPAREGQGDVVSDVPFTDDEDDRPAPWHNRR
jgi:hypothetical protein